MSAARPIPTQHRGAMIAKVKIAQKELGIDDDTYRAILKRLTNQDSASKCSEAQLGRVLDEFKAKGWAPRVVAGGAARPAAPGRKPADHPSAKKARALWISLHQLGVVRDRSDAALESFARRQLGVEALQWADQGLCYKLIEALKKMAERAGWSQDVSADAVCITLRQASHVGGEIRALKVRLVIALWGKLAQFGEIRGAGNPPICGLSEWANARGVTPNLLSVSQWSEDALDGAIAKLGSRVQAAIARKAEAT